MQYSSVGNIFHLLSLASITTYAALVITYANKNVENPIFDAEWLSNGFCVSNIDVPFLNSHDLCLYADTILAGIVMAVYYALRDSPGVKDDKHLLNTVKWSSVSILTHGFAHGSISRSIRQRQQGGGVGTAEMRLTYWEELSQKYDGDMNGFYREFLMRFPMGLLFWYPLLRSSNTKVSRGSMFLLSLAVIAAQAHVPPQFGFMYVQTVISLCVIASDIFFKTLKEKNRYSYATMASVNLQLSMIPYWEAIGCTKGWYKALGGHVIYDVAIPVLLIAAFIDCVRKGESDLKAQKKIA